MRIFTAAVILAISLFSRMTPAFAWGAEGHRIVAFIAASELAPQTQREVSHLLGGPLPEAMVRVSTWADQIRRERPHTASWHYVDIPLGSSGYVAARDCPHGNCVVAQILRDTRRIADRRLTNAVRAQALRFLIHFVADEHQPLHAANDHDRGGNEVHVVLNRRHTNLHAVWDDSVVRALGRSPARVALRLEASITPRERSRWQQGNPMMWANGSFAIASHDIYPLLHGRSYRYAPLILPRDYARRYAPIAALQLQKAGVRLALLLNRAFAAARH